MIKYQKNDGAFTKMAATSKLKSWYEVFLINSEKYAQQSCEDIEFFVDHYKSILEANKSDLELLTKLEEVIMQLRSLEDLRREKNVKFRVGGRGNEYVYAYANFYRHGMSRNDIAEIVGKAEELGANIDGLGQNTNLCRLAQMQLEDKMMDIIRNTRTEVNQLLNKKFGSIKNFV